MRRLRLNFNLLWFRPRAFRLPGRFPVRLTLKIDGAVRGTVLDTEVSNNSPLAMPDDWAFEFDSEARPLVDDRPRPLEYELQIQRNSPGHRERVALIRRSIPWPYQTQSYFDETRKVQSYFSLEDMEPPVERVDILTGLHACRESPGGAMCTTASGGMQRIRVEVHEVIPSPTGLAAPMRPPVSIGDSAGVTFGDAYAVGELGAGSALNVVENPPVIPILPAGTVADATNCARFRVTYYSPPMIALLASGNPELQWRIQAMGGAARFFGPTDGRKVSLHGVTAGDVGLELYYRGNLVAFCRAIVGPLVFIPCRATILHGNSDTAAERALRPTPARIEAHLLTANRFLWQLGIQLRLEAARQPVGWRPAQIPAAALAETATAGIWQATVRNRFTTNVDSDHTVSSNINGREWVANFVYIRSFIGSVLGLSTANAPRPSIWVTDSGTPTTSWIRPSGVLPDAAAGTSRLRLFVAGYGGHPHHFPMLLGDGHANDFEFSGTIAHEFGHTLNLDHRIEDPDHVPEWGDRLSHPPSSNLMHWNNPTTLAQDLDLIQARAARAGPLVTHYLP